MDLVTWLLVPAIFFVLGNHFGRWIANRNREKDVVYVEVQPPPFHGFCRCITTPTGCENEQAKKNS
jgi:hypothetical protein